MKATMSPPTKQKRETIIKNKFKKILLDNINGVVYAIRIA